MRDFGKSAYAALFACIVCFGATPPSAFAATAAPAPDAGAVTEARAHFSRGLALYGEGAFAEARAEIERAYALAPNHRLLYDLALCSNGQGDQVAAFDYLQRYLAEGAQDIEPTRRTEAEQLLAQLRSRLAALTIRANVSGDIAVIVDDLPRGRLTERPIMVSPGPHKIWITKEKYYPATANVTLTEGAATELDLDLRELPHVPEARLPWWRQPYARWAATAGLVIVGAVLTIVMLRKRRPARPPGVLQLNPYHTDVEARIPEPTPNQTNVIALDGESSGPKVPRRLSLVAAAATDTGRVKPSNEDSHLVDLERGVFVVADGIGGFAGGEVASATAVEEIASAYKERRGAAALTHVPTAAGELAIAVFAANAAIRRKAAANVNIADMGSTCVAARFCVETNEVHIVHVGDSRAYRLRAGQLRQLTTDHTMAELGVTGRRAEHLSRALGTEASPRLDILHARLEGGDVYLLCCDGLTKMVAPPTLCRVLTDTPLPEAAVSTLISAANAAGGLDNITAIVVRVS